MTDALGLIEKHRAAGLLVDTNLFVLYLVGKTNKSRILNFKRTQAYSIRDFELLNSLIVQFRVLFTTPHVLTEVSNLATLQGKERRVLHQHFRHAVAGMIELYQESRVLIHDVAFDRLGLTDTAIAADSRDFLVLTDDLDLSITLMSRGIDVINFNHIRTL